MKAAVAWTGGKDCALALHLAKQQGADIGLLVTFCPLDRSFYAHSRKIMALQAAALGLPHRFMIIGDDYERDYRLALSRLKADGFDAVVTGDIDYVGDEKENWIRQCAAGTGLEVMLPLWQSDREVILRQLIDGSFTVVFSAVKQAYFSGDWVGRVLDETSMGALREKSVTQGIDLCGEEGCYHTMVLNMPGFSSPLKIPSFSVVIHDNLYVMDTDYGQES